MLDRGIRMNQKLSYDELVKENQLLKEIIDNVSEGIMVADREGKISIYNKAMEKIENTERKFVLGYTEHEVYNNFSYEDHLSNKVFKSGKSLENQRLAFYMPSGYRVEMLASTFPYYDNGEINAVYHVISDVTDISRLQDRIVTLTSMLKEHDEEKMKRRKNGTVYTFDSILGKSEKFIEVVEKAKKISGSVSNVLIYGETGTGKELFSQSIHNASPYSDGPFVAINCAAIPSTLLESQLFGTVPGAFSDAKDMPGFFEQAEGGTLFLDEINSMDMNLQAKLLRVLQDKTICRLGDHKPKKVNCRIICATNQNPMDPEFKQVFREDLLYRLMTIILFLPPLREHKEDIEVILRYHLEKLDRVYNTKITGFSEDFLALLKAHNWPGNTRQLVNLLESCVCCIDPGVKTLKVEHIPDYLRAQLPVEEYRYQISDKENGDLNDLLSAYEQKIVENAIRKCKGNVSRAARSLGISRQNMNYRLNKFGIKAADLFIEEEES